MTPDIWQALTFLAMAAGGWYMRTQHNRVDALERDLVTHKVEAARSYVVKPDLERLEGKIDSLRGTLDASINRVMDRIDEKVGRP